MTTTQKNTTDTDRLLLIIADIRQALGCGDKLMLEELPGVIKHVRDIASVVYDIHKDKSAFLAGFTKAAPCYCIECEFMRNVLGMK